MYVRPGIVFPREKTRAGNCYVKRISIINGIRRHVAIVIDIKIAFRGGQICARDYRDGQLVSIARIELLRRLSSVHIDKYFLSGTRSMR